MGYFSEQQLKQMPFKKLGRNVKISDKASIYNIDQIEIGDNSRIDDFCVISGNVTIGMYVHITPFCLLSAGEPGIDIGDFCGVSYASQVFAQSDDYTGQFMVNSLIPSAFKKEKKEKVIFEKHAIVGAHCVIMPGVILAEGCSIGAMSLVTKSTKPWGIYIGSPAKRVKDKHRDILLLEKQFLQSVGSLS